MSLLSIPLNLGLRSYNIEIGKDLLSNISDLVVPHLKGRKQVIIISDENVAKIYLEDIAENLSASGVEMHSIVLPTGEGTKSFANLENLLNQILEIGIERSTVLIALGGGVIGDITGFAASVALRGINFIQIPTSLLAMVDSSVGGKTGINTNSGKNLVGSFYQPKSVLIDIDVLKTLPKREWLSGYAEIVKYGLIDDLIFFNFLDNSLDAASIPTDDSEFTTKIIAKSCNAKAKIVAEDEKESGRRALLNFGHTFGHALEAEMNYSDKLLHGEAVAIGMVMAFAYSAYIGICKDTDADLVAEHIKKSGLPAHPKDVVEDWDAKNLLKHMQKDKKVKDGKLVLVLARSIGDVFIDSEQSQEKVLKFMNKYIG